MKKHIPVRSCFICKKRFPKQELLRYVRNKEQENDLPYTADPKQILPGRGIYVCTQSACTQRSLKLGIAPA